MANENPTIVKEMLELVSLYNETAVPILNKPWDPAANPKYWNYNWNNWLDFPAPAGINFTQIIEEKKTRNNQKLFDYFNTNKVV